VTAVHAEFSSLNPAWAFDRPLRGEVWLAVLNPLPIILGHMTPLWLIKNNSKI